MAQFSLCVHTFGLKLQKFIPLCNYDCYFFFNRLYQTMLGHCSRRWPVTEILLDICILIITPEGQADHRAQHITPLYRISFNEWTFNRMLRHRAWVNVGPQSVTLAHIQRGVKHHTVTQYWANAGSAS